MPKPKVGRMSMAELDYIKKNASHHTAESIAAKLNRDVAPVLRYMEKQGISLNKKKNFEVQAEYEIKERPYWKELQAQFSETELELFLYHWKQIVSQFRKDILATEELQIVDTIKLEVLMNRSLREQEEMANTIRSMEGRINRLVDEERFAMEREIISLKSAKVDLSREYKELLKHKMVLFKDLKGTRDQRVKTLDGSKKTFSVFVNQLLQDKDFYDECGVEMERMRLAAKVEETRLADFYTFSDGALDQPLLTPDTVKD